MAQRRMFSKKIVETDFFIDMPVTAKYLYFYLNMEADDDGFVGNPKTIKLISGATEDDFKILIAKKFIIPFESGVVVIKDWLIHNYIRPDRYNETQYLKEKKQLGLTENKEYSRLDDIGIQDVIPLVATGKSKDRLGKDRIGKDRIGKRESKDKTDKKESKEVNELSEANETTDPLKTNSLFSNYFEYFLSLSRKNQSKRAMALQEFLKLPSFDKEKAVIGAKNYTEWYQKENKDDSGGTYSINAYQFIIDMEFKNYQEAHDLNKKEYKRISGYI